MADGCRGKAPGDECRPTIGGGGSCNTDGLCVPFSCGDGEVQEREICDTTAPETCAELSYDYGRTTCSADCSAVISTCDFIDDRDLGLGLEVQVNAVALQGDVLWAAGANGIYRYSGQWERVLEGSWIGLRAIGSDVWALNYEQVAHWNGATWTLEPWTFGIWGMVEVIDGQLVVGQLFNGGALVRRVGTAWVTEVIDSAGSPTAIAVLGGVEVAAYSFFSGDGVGGFYTFTRLYKKDGSGWHEMPFTPELSVVRAIAGTSIDDFIVSGEFFAQANTVLFRTRRIVTDGGNRTINTVPGSGFIVPVGEGSLILPIEPYMASAPADPEVVGTFYRNGIAQRVSIPGRARLVASDGHRVIVAMGNHVRELGGTLRSPTLAVESANPPITHVNVSDLAASPGGDIYALDARGMVWQVMDAATSVPRIVERVRSLVNTIGVWGVGADFVAIASNRLARYSGGTHTDEILADTAHDIAGNAANDIMVVGEGSVAARRFDGGAWVSTTVPGDANLRAVAATGSGFVAVGDNGLVAVFDGETWATRDVGTTENLTAVATAGDAFVVTGDHFAVRCDAQVCDQDTLPWTPSSISMAAKDDILAVGGGKALHFDGVAWSGVDLQGGAPSQVLVRDNTLWFGEGGAAGRIQQLVRMRPWR